MRVEVLSPESPRWAKALAVVRHDVYQLPGYCAVSARDEGGRALAFLAAEGDRFLLLPSVLRPLPEMPVGGASYTSRVDIVSPYGYSSPLLKAAAGPAEGAEFFARALSAVRESMAKLGVVAAFLRLNPLLPLPLDVLARFGRLRQRGNTVAIDLRLSREELWRQTRANHRRGIRRAKTLGYRASIDQGWRFLDEFVDLYLQTMRRVGACERYIFDRAYFLRLREALGDHLHLCLVRMGSRAAAGGLFTEVDGIVQYHLGGTADACVRDAPSKLIFDFVRLWAKDRDNRLLHLGGGVGAAADSLFHFKAGFSPLRCAFHTCEAIVDEEAYRALVSDSERRHGQTAGEEGFFPAYRRSADPPSPHRPLPLCPLGVGLQAMSRPAQDPRGARPT